MDKELNSIHSAIAASKEIIQTHKRSSTLLLLGILMTLFGFFSYFIFSYQDSRFLYKEKITKLTNQYQAARSLTDTLYKQIPDSARKKSYSFSPVLNDVVSEAPSNNIESPTSLINYGIYLFGIVVISILTALYRLHLKEIAKAEQNLTAFYRIRIAANNITEGFGSEVRHALTNNAFYYGIDENHSVFKRGSKVESPIPGHPTSDIVTSLLNKILDSVEIKSKN